MLLPGAWRFAKGFSLFGFKVRSTDIDPVRTFGSILSPLKALSRIHGESEVEEELPGGEVFGSHPLHSLLFRGLQLEEVCGEKVEDGIHINIGELSGLIKSESDAAMSHFPNRAMCLSDSQVALGNSIKGRS